MDEIKITLARKVLFVEIKIQLKQIPSFANCNKRRGKNALIVIPFKT